MRFSIIAPACALQTFSSLSSTHLLLAHVDNPLYWKFYQNLSYDPKQLLILDNSAYEGKMDMDLVLQRLNVLRPTVLVLPDLIGTKAQESFEVSAEFLKRWRQELPCDFMYVPQFDGTYLDYKEMLKYVHAMLTAFGIKWFGIPRLTADLGYSRSELCLAIKRERSSWGDEEPYVHALGMRNGSLRELQELDEAQCDSIDSSAPVWRGWNGYDIEASKAWALHGVPCNFDVHPDTLTPENETLIFKNLRKVGIQC